MRSLLGFLTVVAVSFQHADSFIGPWGRFDYKVIRTHDAHPMIEIWWKESWLCDIQEVHVYDPAGPHRVIDLTGWVPPYMVKSTPEYPTANWIIYKLWFRYKCRNLLSKPDVRYTTMYVTTWSGEPLPLRNLEITTDLSSATVHWEVPGQIKHSWSIKPAEVIVQLLNEENYHSEPRRIPSALEGPLKLDNLSPGVVYTVVVFLEIAKSRSEPIKAKFIVGALEDQTALEGISSYRTETAADIQWGNTKKENLSPFVVQYSVAWRALRENSTWDREITESPGFVLKNLRRRDKYIVDIHAYLRCGNRTIKGANNTVFIDPMDEFRESWELMFAGAVLAILGAILISVILSLCLRLLSKRRERRRKARAKLLEQTSCFSNIPTLPRQARCDESQSRAESSSSDAGRPSD